MNFLFIYFYISIYFYIFHALFYILFYTNFEIHIKKIEIYKCLSFSFNSSSNKPQLHNLNFYQKNVGS